MGNTGNWVDNPFYSKEEYENFLKQVIEPAEETDYPIVIQPVPHVVSDINAIHEFEKMVEKDTGLHASVQCPTCCHCGRISSILIIYP